MKKMLKRADGSTSQRGLWDNIRAKAAANKKAGKKGNAPSEDILRQEKAINAKKTDGKSMSSFIEESKELMFGGPSKKYLMAGPTPTPKPTPAATPAPAMSFEEGLKGYMSGKLTGAQANAATGYGTKQKKYTDAQNKENLGKVFSGTHVQDAQGNIVPKVNKTGGKKKMGGKNC
jgi:hypothetical protein